MKKSPSTLSSLLIIGFFVFCLLSTSTQIGIANKIENLFSLNEGTLSKHLESDGGGSSNPETKSTKVRSQEAIEYYNEVVMSSEFEGRRTKEFKWTTDMKIYVEGEPTSELLSELDRIVTELNDIINPINITFVSNRSEANYFVYFGSYTNFAKNYPNIDKTYLKDNWGYFEAYTNKGFMYVDVVRCTDTAAQKHLIREELTQSLGLFNDSYKYPESIYYQGWTTTTEYAPIDVELIEMLYNE
jgi:hypothetical protein